MCWGRSQSLSIISFVLYRIHSSPLDIYSPHMHSHKDKHFMCIIWYYCRMLYHPSRLNMIIIIIGASIVILSQCKWIYYATIRLPCVWWIVQGRWLHQRKTFHFFHHHKELHCIHQPHHSPFTSFNNIFIFQCGWRN